jgi:hypothetical protein
MQKPPELFTPLEERAIAEMIETNVDFWQEQKHIHELDVLE